MKMKKGIVVAIITVGSLITFFVLRNPQTDPPTETPPPPSIAAVSPASGQATQGALEKPRLSVPAVASPQGLAVVGQRESALEELLKSAPPAVSNEFKLHGIPPLPLETNDPYREVTFVNPNGGPPRVLKAHSVEPIIDAEGKTNAFAIRYMKGQRPFTNANDGTILVGPIVNPGGAK
jgi:hypothetical protein